MPRQTATNRSTLNWFQNLFQRSNEFSNAYWTKDQVSVTANQIANPLDGTVDAWLMTDTATPGSHRIYGGLLAMVGGLVYCHSIYVKDNNRRYLGLTEDGTSGFTCILDLQTGTITASTFDTAKYHSVSFSLQALPNGWYRIWAIFLPKANTNVFTAFSLSSGSAVGNINYVGDGTKSVYIYQAQLVRANWPGFPTVTTSSASSTAIRNARTNPQTLNFSQNNYLYSEDLTNAAWTKQGPSSNPSQSSIAGPYGTNVTANLFTEDTGTSYHSAFAAGGAVNANSYYTVSAYFKDVDRRYCGFDLDMGTGGNQSIIFDLQAGTAGTPTTNSAGVIPGLCFGTIEQLSNGWYRCTFTIFSRIQLSAINPRICLSNGTNIIYTGTSKSMYIWGGQFVNANWPAVYTATTGSRVTTAVRNLII